MRYTDSHEWIRIEKEEATIGISAYARDQLGEIVYVELPEVGEKVMADSPVAVLESTKAATDVYAPLSGTVIRINDALRDNITPLNVDPESSGWLCTIRLSEEPGATHSRLHTPEAYRKLLTSPRG